ncbi:MAG TPA: GrpB family protein [Acidimicrobiales bacterium]|nr:GrpB family protein [Acidimicrobiales bacterium]
MRLDDKVILSAWRPEWTADFEVLAERLKVALGVLALRIDHIGSTSVPALPAKDVIDAQVIVARLDRGSIIGSLTDAGFIHRDASWNRRDHVPAGWSGDPDAWAKLVFAAPPDTRDGNVHIRIAGSPNERYALLFRDFLRADETARKTWGRFKTELAKSTRNLAGYGAVKDPATDLLLDLAEVWAAETAWTVPTG